MQTCLHSNFISNKKAQKQRKMRNTSESSALWYWHTFNKYSKLHCIMEDSLSKLVEWRFYLYLTKIICQSKFCQVCSSFFDYLFMHINISFSKVAFGIKNWNDSAYRGIIIDKIVNSSYGKINIFKAILSIREKSSILSIYHSYPGIIHLFNTHENRLICTQKKLLYFLPNSRHSFAKVRINSLMSTAVH